jgi:hypothetical protein
VLFSTGLVLREIVAVRVDPIACAQLLLGGKVLARHPLDRVEDELFLSECERLPGVVSLCLLPGISQPIQPERNRERQLTAHGVKGLHRLSRVYA